MLALISFIFVILIVVSVHEYGHYVAARCLGVRVLRFSIGFGKPLFCRRDRHGTEWAIAPILLGGYVRLLDKEAVQQYGLPPAESVEAQSHLRRIIIYAAGPLANILLSLVIILLLLAGGEQGLRPLVDSVRPQSPAARIGFAVGDELAAVNGDATALWRHADVALIDAVLSGKEIILDTTGGRRHAIAADSLSLDDVQRYGGAAAALGIYPYQDYIKLKVATVLPDSPAAIAGMEVGDDLVMMNGVLLEHWRQAVDIIERNASQPVSVVVWRGGSPQTLTATPAPVQRGRSEKGHLGIAPQVDRDDLAQRVVTLSYSPPALIGAAAKQTSDDVVRALSFLRLLFTAEVASEHVSGPVGIAMQSSEAAALGLGVWLRFVTLISTSLGILNLLPLPLLDGGQIVLSMVQWIRRRDFTDDMLRVWHISGAVVLLMLMAAVIINDIVQLF